MILRSKKYPRVGTDSARRYYYSDLETGNFLNWITFMASTMDEMQRIASEALAESRGGKPENNAKIMLAELKKNRTLLFHMLHSRLIDNYLTYLSEVLVECFKAKPESMRSSEKVELSEILKFDNFADLVVYVADRKVHELSYQSISDLDDYFSTRFGVDLVSNSDLPRLIEAVETRNLITHNRAVISMRYLRRVSGDQSRLGSVREIGIDYFRKIDTLLFESVTRLDRALRKKLGVRGHRFDIYVSFRDRA